VNKGLDEGELVGDDPGVPEATVGGALPQAAMSSAMTIAADAALLACVV
jgi:hypothetical protein